MGGQETPQDEMQEMQWCGIICVELVDHRRAKHFGLNYECKECEHQSVSRSSLRQHVKSSHNGFQYQCKKCDYNTKFSSSLRMHVQTSHESFKYNCEKWNLELYL